MLVMFSFLLKTNFNSFVISNLSSANSDQSKVLLFGKELTFFQKKVFDTSKLKKLADDNLKFNGNGRKFSTPVENTEKRSNCLLYAISPFPTVFLKDLHCRQSKTWACLGKG